MTIEEVMNYLYEERAKDLPADALSEVFDRLIWCMSDNGAELLEVRRKWIEGDDKFKCQIALLMRETFPYESYEKMNSQLKRIRKKWPELDEQCNKMLSGWKSQFA
jgi:hypothetical protein